MELDLVEWNGYLDTDKSRCSKTPHIPDGVFFYVTWVENVTNIECFPKKNGQRIKDNEQY